jgi:cytochrome oxidase Cu insertion factor (SCO1/SenC/PrrC family)
MHRSRIRHLAAGLLFGCAAVFSGGAAALDVGDKAPAFAAPSTTGKEIKLADFAGKQNVVLFFYIGAFTNT